MVGEEDVYEHSEYDTLQHAKIWIVDLSELLCITPCQCKRVANTQRACAANTCVCVCVCVCKSLFLQFAIDYIHDNVFKIV